MPIIYNQNIECTAAAFSMNGQWLAVGFTDGTIRIFDVQKNREIQTLPSSYGKIKSLAVPSDGRLLTVVFEKNITHKAILYNLQTAQETEKFFNATVAAFSPDGKLLALAVDAGAVDKLQLFEVQSREIVRSVDINGTVITLTFFI